MPYERNTDNELSFMSHATLRVRNIEITADHQLSSFWIVQKHADSNDD